MCQCGCGDTNVEQAFQLPNKNVIGIQTYRGCEDCHSGPGFMAYLFTPKGAREWVPQWVKREPIQFDEFGGRDGLGISVGLFEIQDLQAAAKELEAQQAIEEWGGDFEEWLGDEGLRWIQRAMDLFTERVKAMQAERAQPEPAKEGELS